MAARIRGSIIKATKISTFLFVLEFWLLVFYSRGVFVAKRNAMLRQSDAPSLLMCTYLPNSSRGSADLTTPRIFTS